MDKEFIYVTHSNNYELQEIPDRNRYSNDIHTFQRGHNNFCDFEEAFRNNPKTLLLLRLASGMPQKQFCASSGITRSALTHYELGISKSMKSDNLTKALVWLKKMQNSLDFSEDTIIRNYRNLWRLAREGQQAEALRRYGRSAFKTRKPNKSEETILNLLVKNDFRFQREGFIEFDGLPFFFDFILPDAKNPKSIIESKKVSGTKNRNFRIIMYRIAYEIGYKSRLLKEKYPGIKIAVILESENNGLPERVIRILKKEVDYFLHNAPETEMNHLFKKLNSPNLG